MNSTCVLTTTEMASVYSFLIMCSVAVFVSGNTELDTWVPNEALGSEYYFGSTVGLTFFQARDVACTSMGAHGVTITSAEEDHFIQEKILEIGGDWKYWTGGHQGMFWQCRCRLGIENMDEGSEHCTNCRLSWEWITGEPMIYTNWLPDLPMSYLQREGVVRATGWDSNFGPDNQTRYLCEREYTGPEYPDGNFDCGNNNPCLADVQFNADGEAFFASNYSFAYVMCVTPASCHYMPCPEGAEWQQQLQRCVHPTSPEPIAETTGATAEEECVNATGTVTSILCEDRGWAVLTCERYPSSMIYIHEANFGRTEPASEICPHHRLPTYNTTCVAETTVDVVQTECAGLQWCALPATSTYFGDTCPGIYKYLTITYGCVCG